VGLMQQTDAVYLDHAGTTLYSKSLMERFSKEMASNLFGNPHSGSPSSQLSTTRIEDTRLRVLQFFHADPTDFDVVFVANATAGIKLVAEAVRSLPGGFDYAYHQASHTSVVGLREEAENSACLDTCAVERWLKGDGPFEDSRASNVLFAYPAQSNMDGRRFPLSWVDGVRRKASSTGRRAYTMLDAAALVATSTLDLSDADAAPDFIVMSFYKIFGFPDLGCLIVRRNAEHVFDTRRYFGGGTVDMVVCVKEQWHASKTQFLHERLEDGTLPFHSIIALDAAMTTHQHLFGSMKHVGAHTAYLSRLLFMQLSQMKHGNGRPVCTIYSPDLVDGTEIPRPGPIIAFNIQNSSGAWISPTEFEKLATLKQFHIRTGGVCSPGGIATALGLEPWEIRRNFSAGARCGNENDIMAGKPTGVIRVSLGAMSTISDVSRFTAFVDEFYRGRNAAPMTYTPRQPTGLRVASITVYPIKSCGGFAVPGGMDWEVRPEGLRWDREWCLIHRGTGQALSQKRHPKMALIRPILDFPAGKLRVLYSREPSDHKQPGVPTTKSAFRHQEISVPLSEDPAVFERISSRLRSRSSRVCGEEIFAQAYTSEEVNGFFSDVLGVPCCLARFPPGGQGKNMRHAKAHLQKHQKAVNRPLFYLPGAFPAPPTPPDSDSEQVPHRILLSNESPILAIHTASLRALNAEIRRQGGQDVAASVFRANIVLESPPPSGASSSDKEALPAAYSEDTWSGVRIGRDGRQPQQRFKMLGSCRRCHMVCINQETGEKNEEPFVTLSKTRRFDGKVFFGTHMGYDPPPIEDIPTAAAQFPTIMVGDVVEVD